MYLTHRISKKPNAQVEAKLLEPLFAFDREVIPAGTIVQGTVSRVQPVRKWLRAKAILNGDFTPLRNADVEFTTLILPGGKTLPLHTLATEGLTSLYVEPSKSKRRKARMQTQNGGILGTAKQTARDRLNAAINSRTYGIADIVRGPNKKEKLADFFWAKLPYHPQYVRRGTRFDAPLRDPLEFGSETIASVDFAETGSQPAKDSIARVRLLTSLDSATAKQGDPVEAVVAAPLFSADHKLVLPEGTRLTGTVVMAKRARSFHRPGQLRFNFQQIVMPADAEKLRSTAPTFALMKTQATVESAEASGDAPVKVDQEGGVKAQESKTRFIAPVISLLLASRAADNDAGRNHNVNGSSESNVGGRTLGGGLGFGLLGAAASQSSKFVGMAFGYYGLAWSVYSNVIARGGEVEFDKNAMMDIRFGERAPHQASKFREASGQ